MTKRILTALLISVLLFAVLACKKAEKEEEAGVESEAVAGIGKYSESPMLAEMVKAGEIPPLEDRLPKEPLVLQPIEEIGKYGGTIQVFAGGEDPWQDMQIGGGISQGLFRLTRDGSTTIGNIARDLELSEDAKTITIFLREGLKWSDGAPFVADDIVFYFDDIQNNDEVRSWNVLGAIRRTRKIDDLTVALEMDHPGPAEMLNLGCAASWRWFAFQPKHYLAKYHITHNPDADKLAKEEGYETWEELLHAHMWWAPQKDLDLPCIDPWKLVRTDSTGKLFERNPYYWKVDPEGKQLPYIDRISVSIIGRDAYDLKIISGEADIAYSGTSLDNYTLYKESEQSGDYRVLLMKSGVGGEVGFGINVNHPDPAMRELYEDVRFRQAISAAIDREEINKVVYLDLAFPRQATVLPNVSFFKQEWEDNYAQFDPDQANKLLDEIGLTTRDRNGFRMLPGGAPLEILVEHSATGARQKVLELVEEYWENVGLRTNMKFEESSFYNERRGTSDHGITVINVYAVDEVTCFYSSAEPWHGGGSDFSYARDWGIWLREKGRQVEEELGEGVPVPVDWRFMETNETEPLPGEEPPDEWKQLDQWVEEWGMTHPGTKEYLELGEKIFDYHAEKLYIIGTVGMAPKPLIAKNNLRNIPPGDYDDIFGPAGRTWWSDQFFFEED